MSPATDSTRYRLSKSKIAVFEHCPKRLWLQIHARHLSQHDQGTLDRFQFGHDVGQLAQFRVPGGVLVDTGLDMEAALQRTAELIVREDRRPIFEATFQHEDVLVRVDVLDPDHDSAWRAIEVKASTSVKPYQLSDLATQVWVMRQSGLQISSGIIRHIAKPFSWLRHDISGVRLQDAEVTCRLTRYINTRPATVAAARKTIRAPYVHQAMGRHCEAPFACEFHNHCRRMERIPLLARAEAASEC